MNVSGFPNEGIEEDELKLISEISPFLLIKGGGVVIKHTNFPHL